MHQNKVVTTRKYKDAFTESEGKDGKTHRHTPQTT